MVPSSSNNNQNENNSSIVDLSSSSEEYPDYIPGDPNNPYDYRHYIPGGIYEHQNKRKHSSSSEASGIPPSKKPMMPSSAAVQEITPNREAERPARPAPPNATFRNTPLAPGPTVPSNAPIFNPQPAQSNMHIPENGARVNPQPGQPNMGIPPPRSPPNPFTQPLAYLYASSPSYRNLLFELKSENSRHDAKIRQMNEIHALEERLSQVKHTADMRRLQELIIREKNHHRDVARFEMEVERERHQQMMGVIGRQIAAQQKDMMEKAGVREDGTEREDR